MCPLGLQSLGLICTNMFISHTANLSPASRLYLDKTQSQWNAIELALNRPWFLVSFQQLEAEADCAVTYQRTMLVESLVSVEQFLRASSDGLIKVDAIQVVTPGEINGSSNWKMDVLDSVVTAEDPDNEGMTANVFVTCGGKKYADSWTGTPLEKLKLGEVRFKSPAG